MSTSIYLLVKYEIGYVQVAMNDACKGLLHDLSNSTLGKSHSCLILQRMTLHVFTHTCAASPWLPASLHGWN